MESTEDAVRWSATIARARVERARRGGQGVDEELLDGLTRLCAGEEVSVSLQSSGDVAPRGNPQRGAWATASRHHDAGRRLTETADYFP